MSVEKEKRLNEAHMQALTEFVYKLRNETKLDVLFFDTFDGGINAKALFLLEKPGPKSSTSNGSGFISRDNDDETARAVKSFLEQADLSREETIIWNVIPAWNGTRAIVKDELIEGHRYLDELINLLPKLKVVVLVGLKSINKAEKYLIKNYNFYIVKSFHPSPIVKASNFAKWNAIAEQWKQVRTYLDIQ